MAAPKTEIASSLALPPDGQEWRSSHERAVELLTWLRAPGGRIGEITSKEMQEIYAEFLATKGWPFDGWVAVARDLRKILGVKKEKNRHGVTVFRITAAPLVAEMETRRRSAA